MDHTPLRLIFVRDGMNDNQKPLISRHPRYSNLTLACVGGYNRAKFIVSLGREIVEVANGSRSRESHGWDSVQQPEQCDQRVLLSNRNFEDLEQEAAGDPVVKHWRSERHLNAETEYYRI